MTTDRKQTGSAASESRSRSAWFLALLLVASAAGSACSSKDTPSTEPAPAGECDGRADAVSAGMSLASKEGYTFELSKLEPSIPVQSGGPPGNRWTVTVTDPNGAKVTGATLAINTFMPVHMHGGPSTAGFDHDDGSYDVADLIFPMPALYTVSFLLTLKREEEQPVDTPAIVVSVALTLCLDTASG